MKAQFNFREHIYRKITECVNCPKTLNPNFIVKLVSHKCVY